MLLALDTAGGGGVYTFYTRKPWGLRLQPFPALSTIQADNAA